MSVPFSIDQVRQRLGRHSVVRLEATRRASVALILEPVGQELQLLLIRRAEHPDDPWSGHMALPGGRRESSDESDMETAIRETREEVGIALERQAELLGELDHLRATASGSPLDLAIAPFVFCMKTVSQVVPSREVTEAHWVPLPPLFDGRAESRLSVERPSGTISVPAWSVANHYVWGLTYRMIQSLFDLMKAEPCV